MSQIKDHIKDNYFQLQDALIPKKKGKVKQKSIVILKMDAIGDYILFRNFIYAIKESEKYKDYSITLIGNKLWKRLAHRLDHQVFDRVIGIDPYLFKRDFRYRRKALNAVSDSYYSVFFHPTYSREYYVSEKIANFIQADVSIAAEGDLSNFSGWQKEIADKKYQKLLPADPSILFEFNRNKRTVEDFIGDKIELNKPKIKLKDKKDRVVEKPYVLLFIGGGADFRKWSNNHWILLADRILQNYDLDVVLSGGPQDLSNAMEIKYAFEDEDRVHNQCATCTLHDLLSIIDDAELMISNETSAPHMSSALGTPVIVVSNGNHYGRFTPYPEDINEDYQAVYPPSIMKMEVKERVKRFAEGSSLKINSVKPDVVYKAAERRLEELIEL